MARLRFAPSPTGALHIGGIRTALYNYLLARQLKGAFILRIEDTDQARYVPGAEEYIIESLKWLGLQPDEGPGMGGEYGPYRQSERKEIYFKHALQLIEKGEAYYAFDDQDALEALRESDGGNQKYDAQTRLRMKNSLTLSSEQVNEHLQSGMPFVIRLKVPANHHIRIEDAIRGEVTFQTSELDDKVLIKSDGMPTYHMANVVDDRLMKISHVIRGEEWLSSTAHHVLLYKAFGWEDQMPEFAHLPLILKPTGNGKLSKRDGAQFGFPVFPLDWKAEDGSVFMGFREFGFEPDALLNFLALLGWNPGTNQEIFHLDEMIQQFSIHKIVKSGARFDFDKAKWFNQQYLLKADAADQCKKISADFLAKGIALSDQQAEGIFRMYHDRVHFFQEYFKYGSAFLIDIENYDESYISGKFKNEFIGVLSSFQSILQTLPGSDRQEMESKVKMFVAENSIKAGEFFPLLRVIMTGIPTGPDVFQMLLFCGIEKLNKRIEKFVHFIENKKSL